MIKKFGSHEAYKEHMRSIAAKGGKNGRTGGFFANRAAAVLAGEKGGRISKRRKGDSKKKVDELNAKA